LLPLLGNVSEIEIGCIERLELVLRSITGCEDVRERGAVFLDEAEQHVAALFDSPQAARVALDGRCVASHRLDELFDVRERPVQELLPLGR